MAFDNSCTKAVLSASPGLIPERFEPQLFLAALGQVICCWKALDLGSLNMQFQHDWPKEKNYSSFNFFTWKPEKYRWTEFYDAPLEGSTIFLYRSSTSRTSLVISGLAELKYAFFSNTGSNTKNYGARTFFNWLSLSMAPRSIDNFTSIQLHKPYKVGKLSIRRVKMCHFSRIRRNTEE